MHVTNTSDFTMADLSTEAVVLASPSNEESKRLVKERGDVSSLTESVIVEC